MNTKILMTFISLMLAAAGIIALFVPDQLMTLLNVPRSDSLLVVIQLMGALYFSFALMNWTAKDSAIGGIYARPVSLANFSHFLIGTLLLIKYQLSHPFSLPITLALVVYTMFASLFYWLVFHATGIVVPKSEE